MRNLRGLMIAREDTRLRIDVEATLTSKCSIERKTSVVDDMGGSEDTWASITGGQTVDCSLNEVRGNKLVSVDVIKTGLVYVFQCPLGTDITEKDRVVIGTDTFEISGIRKPTTAQIALQAYVEVAK